MKTLLVILLSTLCAGCYVKVKTGSECYAFAMVSFEDPCKDKELEKQKEKP